MGFSCIIFPWDEESNVFYFVINKTFYIVLKPLGTLPTFLSLFFFKRSSLTCQYLKLKGLLALCQESRDSFHRAGDQEPRTKHPWLRTGHPRPRHSCPEGPSTWIRQTVPMEPRDSRERVGALFCSLAVCWGCDHRPEKCNPAEVEVSEL